MQPTVTPPRSGIERSRWFAIADKSRRTWFLVSRRGLFAGSGRIHQYVRAISSIPMFLYGTATAADRYSPVQVSLPVSLLDTNSTGMVFTGTIGGFLFSHRNDSFRV